MHTQDLTKTRQRVMEAGRDALVHACGQAALLDRSPLTQLLAVVVRNASWGVAAATSAFLKLDELHASDCVAGVGGRALLYYGAASGAAHLAAADAAAAASDPPFLSVQLWFGARGHSPTVALPVCDRFGKLLGGTVDVDNYQKGHRDADALWLALRVMSAPLP